MIADGQAQRRLAKSVLVIRFLEIIEFTGFFYKSDFIRIKDLSQYLGINGYKFCKD